MKIIVIFLLIFTVIILNSSSALAQIESEVQSERTIVAPALASSSINQAGNFYPSHSLAPETAFALTILAIIFLTTGLAILKLETFSERFERLTANNQYNYTRQI